MATQKRDRDDLAVGHRIRKLREAYGLKQQTLATMLGNASHSMVSEIELGKRQASMPVLRALSRIFHVSVAYLMGEDGTAEHVDPETIALKASFRAALERIQSRKDAMADAIREAFDLLEHRS